MLRYLAVMRHGLVITSVCSLLLAACSSGLDANDSLVAFGATYAALSQGQAQAQVAANGMAIVEGDDTSFRGLGVHPRAGANVNYDWACTSGGTAHYAGAAEAVLDDAGASTVTFDLTAEFDACAVNGITLTGDLEYAVDVETTAETLYLKSTMKGAMSYEGQLEGSCDWSLTMKIATSSAGAGTVNAEFSGSICGHDAAATLTAHG